MLLKDKVCLVTGANRGIGAAITQRFAEEGAVVFAVARKPSSLNDMTVTLNQKTKGMVYELYFDVTSSMDAKNAVHQIKKEYGHLDVLVNNAGIMKDALLGMITRSSMIETFETNVFAPIEMMQLASKLMIKQKAGSIINVASIVGVNGNTGQTVYSASKGAVIAMTKTAAKELSDKGIRVNAIAPGMIETDMFLSIGEERARDYIDKIGFKRFGEPNEVADVCVFLASDLSRYVSGQIIGVDGSTVL